MATLFDNSHHFIQEAAAAKARAAITGFALGDALGLYTEFFSMSISKKVYPNGIVFGETPLNGDSHRDKFSKGSWTDDTDHALLLVLSILHYYTKSQRSPDPATLAQDFAVRLNCWCEQGLLALSTPRLGLGATIATVALAPDYLDNPTAKATEIWNKSSSKAKPASNGSLVRAHPLGILAAAYEHELQAFELAVQISRTTHAEPRCSLACATFVAVLRGLFRGEIMDEEDLDRTISRTEAWSRTKPTLIFDGIDVTAEADEEQLLYLDEFRSHVSSSASYDSLQLDEVYKIGYIYKCLGAGIYTLRQAMRSDPSSSTASSQFAGIMTDLVMMGGDSDTNATVAGALLGAWYGEAGLPQTWIEKLNHKDWMQSKALRFVSAAGIPNRWGDKSWRTEPREPDTDVHGGRKPLTKDELTQREIALLETMTAKKKAWNEEIERQKAKDEASSGWRRIFAGSK